MSLTEISPTFPGSLGPLPIVFLAKNTGLPESCSSPLHQTVVLHAWPWGKAVRERRRDQGRLPALFSSKGPPCPVFWPEKQICLGVPRLCVGCSVWIWPTLGSKEKKTNRKLTATVFIFHQVLTSFPNLPATFFPQNSHVAVFLIPRPRPHPGILVEVSGREQRQLQGAYSTLTSVGSWLILRSGD